MSVHTPPHQTQKKDRLSVSEKLCYGSGSIPFTFAYMGLGTLAFPIFNITLGMSATLIGVVLGIGRLWDAVTDPVMGSISDNARTRWGRRRPFILLGGILCGIAFPIMYMVPAGWDQQGIFIWFLVTALIMYTASTVLSVPWLSLSYELTPDSMERVRIQAYRTYIGAGVGMALPWIYRLAQADVFGSTMTGMRWLSLLVGVAFMIFVLPVFFGTRERYAKTAGKQQKIGVITGLKETLKNRPFLILVGGIVTTMLCAPMLVGSLAIYINCYHVFEGDTKAGAALAATASTLFVTIKFIIIPGTLKLSSLFGKRTVMRWSLIIGFFASISKFFFYTPHMPYLQFATIALLAPALTTFWLLVDPMKADCADYDEYTTGMRREGTYAAVANWIEKVSITVVLLFSGVIIDLSGFDPDLGGNQPENTMLILRLAFSIVPTIAFSIALLALHFYPLGENKMHEIRLELEKRRGEV
jgi:GPH family glycoside/pentoside/hexuronide:cation symporter